jgi:hypothetical protein
MLTEGVASINATGFWRMRRIKQRIALCPLGFQPRGQKAMAQGAQPGSSQGRSD